MKYPLSSIIYYIYIFIRLNFLPLYSYFLIGMKNFFIVFFVILQFAVFSACTSVDSDAKKAADAVFKSYELTTKGKLTEAEKYYNKYKKIDREYKGTDDYNKFREAYNKYISILNK